MPTIFLTCPGCRENYAVPDSAAGRKVRCPGCAAVFTAPATRPTPVPPAAPADDPFAFSSPSAEPARRPSRRRSDDDERRRPSSGFPKWLIAVAAAGLVTAGGVTAYFVFRSPAGPTDDPQPVARAGEGAKEPKPEPEKPTRKAGEIPAELLDALTLITVKDSEGNAETGIGFFLAADLVCGVNLHAVKYPVVKQKTFEHPDLTPANPERVRGGKPYFAMMPNSFSMTFVLTREPSDQPPAELARFDPTPGDEVYLITRAGTGDGKPTFRTQPAKVGERVQSRGTTYWIALDFVPPEGWTYGGPAFDEEGKIVGMVVPPVEDGSEKAAIISTGMIQNMQRGWGKIIEGTREQLKTLP